MLEYKIEWLKDGVYQSTVFQIDPNTKGLSDLNLLLHNLMNCRNQITAVTVDSNRGLTINDNDPKAI